MFAYLVHPDLSPTILDIVGPLAIRWYSLMYIVGFGFCLLFLYISRKKNKLLLKPEEVSDIAFTIFLGLLIGARLGFMLFYDFSGMAADLTQIFRVWEGGMSFHGGMIGMIIALLIYSLTKKRNFVELLDVFVVPIPVALACGRWGNFINQELWGKPTSMPWGMIFPKIPPSKYVSTADPVAQQIMQKAGIVADPSQQMINLPRHPTQLYEMCLEGIVLFLILYILYRKKNLPRGILISTFMLGYGLSRFFVEFWREPDQQLGYLFGGWLTMGIVLSLPMILIGIGGLIYFNLNKKGNSLWASSAN